MTSDSRDNIPFEEVYEQYYDRLFNMIYMKLMHREDTEDVVEDTFIKAMKAYSGYDSSKASVGTWLYRIANNCMLDHIRKEKRRVTEPLEVIGEFGLTDPELDALTEGYNITTIRILSKLKDSDKEMLMQRYGMGLDNSEIADILGISSKTVSKRFERLLDKCRKIADGL